MAGALDASGTAVGVLADSLLKAAVAHRWRGSLRRGDLVLLSPFHPQADFSVGNAMARNKYVYCLAVAAVVVHSGRSGGTWNGALENLERGWVPLWVKPTADREAGNAGLIQRGGHWLPEPLSETVVRGVVPSGEPPPATPPEAAGAGAASSHAEVAAAPGLPAGAQVRVAEPSLPPRSASGTGQGLAELSLYEVFCLKLEQVLADGARKPEELAALTGLTGVQLEAWLQQATEDGLVTKRTKPECYALARLEPSPQLGMFDAG